MDGRARRFDTSAMAVYRPDRETFHQLASSAGEPNLLPLYRRLMSDQLTPVLAYRRLVLPDDRLAPSFLLESVEGGERVGRYSSMGAQPMGEVIAYRDEVTVRIGDRQETRTVADPLGEMARLTRAWRLASLPDLPGFTGGWVGEAGYETVRYAEPEKLTDPPPDDRGLPDLHFGLYRRVVVFDHVQKAVLAITHVLLDEHASVDAAYDAGCRELDDMVERIERTPAPLPAGEVDVESPPPPLPTSNMGETGYRDAVRTIREYIAAGDVFQVVPSQRFELQTETDPFDLYRALRMVNPSPYMFYLQATGCILVGSSPEILCRVDGRTVTNRPLAGTRRRGRDPEEDRALEQELRADEKEIAEHVMLLDLGRNDVGKVAEPGSVRLPAVLAVERYSHVMHISSTVTGRLKEGLTSWDALRATLPVGTVSGAPKVRAMQIIDELEPTRRGPYAGAVGHVDLAGNMDMAIALRTMVVLPADPTVPEGERPTWRVHLQAGGGIVADSEPDAEHEETVNKAAAMAKAVDVAAAAFRGRAWSPERGL